MIQRLKTAFSRSKTPEKTAQEPVYKQFDEYTELNKHNFGVGEPGSRPTALDGCTGHIAEFFISLYDPSNTENTDNKKKIKKLIDNKFGEGKENFVSKRFNNDEGK